MIFKEGTLKRLLGSIEADRLVLLCGAGLSMASPSNLKSTVEISRHCYDKYKQIHVLPIDTRDDIDKLADHFYQNDEFESVFIGRLVPWDELCGEPNPGHVAIADFLICRAAIAALSSNFDNLIEMSANLKKISMRGALDGYEANAYTSYTNPLIKFHGCLVRCREETLWTRAQLTEPTIQNRIEACSKWMELQLPGKDLLIIGFWTDWGYLNDVLTSALNVTKFGSVTVIDPSSESVLQDKAPDLWARLDNGQYEFEHITASGSEALAELRSAFSKVWLRKFYVLGKALLEEVGKNYTEIDPDMSDDDLYYSRCDAEGVPYDHATKLKEPLDSAAQAAFFHHLLLQGNATRSGSWYDYKGNIIRVVQGAGQGLNDVCQRYNEPPAVQPDIVVCAGAHDPTTPGRIIETGSGANIVKPAPGGIARWLTLEQAREELSI